MNVLDEVLADLVVEGGRLEAMVAHLDADAWRTPTPAAGWDVAAQIAHLAWTDEVAVAAATDKVAWDAIVLEAIADPTGYVDALALAGAQAPPAELLGRWQSARPALVHALKAFPRGEKLPWFGPPMSPASMATARFMETWAHGLDVADALGIEVEPTDRVRHVVHLGIRTRNFAFANNELAPPKDDFRIDVVAPSGEVWSFGPDDAPQTVTGSAYDFALLVTQRRHRADLDLAAVGADADRWLDVAQAFAGPPGSGREARR